MNKIKTSPFTDLHLHGVGGIDFMHANSAQMAQACELLGARGIGVFAPTLLTGDPKLLAQACRQWGEFIHSVRKNNGKNFSPQAAIPVGIHLEGPFLSPDMSGAHPKNQLARPTRSAVTKFLNLCQGELAIVTIAPELPGAINAIKQLTKAGVRVQLGHSMGTEAQVAAAVNAGATGVTHLFNAMRFHHRNTGLFSALFGPPSPEVAQGSARKTGAVSAEIITDGLHVAAPVVLWASRGFGPRIYAVSDGCAAVGCRPSAKSLSLGSLKLKRQGDTAVVAGSGVLAGGATWITDHPARLYKALKHLGVTHTEIFPFFSPPTCRHLQRRFERFKKLPNYDATRQQSLVFDAKTLKFLGRNPHVYT